MRALVALLTVTLVLLEAAPVRAAEGRLQALGGMSRVFVWRDKASHSEGLSLLQSGESNAMLLAPLLSCIAASGTRAVTTSVGVMTHDIVVVEGPEAGCRGNIPVEAFRRN
jgi:hypothetical protein